MHLASSTCAAAIVLGTIIACGPLFAQTPPPSTADKAAIKQKAADELEIQRQRSAQELAAELKARKEWDMRRRQIIEDRRLQQAECKKQANQQKLHLVKRWRFLKKCAAR